MRRAASTIALLAACSAPAASMLAACSGPPPPPPAPAESPSAPPPPPPAEPAAADSASAPAAASAPTGPPEAPPGMLWVPGGTFTMGAEKGGQEDERPEHAVTLRGFFLDETEVTNEAYGRCVEASKCRPHDTKSATVNKLGEDRLYRKPRQPISSISWDDATAYCAFVGKRLPGEAEWERAARGDDGRRFPWGNEPPTHERAVFSEGPTAEVGSRPAGRGPYGHLDLAGNVWEWVADHYDPYAYRRPGAAEGRPGSCDEIIEAQNELRREGRRGFTGTNPIPTECERVLRGGAFNYDGPGLRASNRVHHGARYRLVMSGFRCAKDGPPG
jgi:formylglycine-generating enzyme required for sulfatase activity